MFLDARTIPDGTTIEADLCILGAGAAGITLARELLLGTRLRIALVEAGGLELDPTSQEFYAAAGDIGLPFPDPTVTRLRQFGGTTNHWAGWCLPLDPVDFKRREGLPWSGWPFDRAALDPWYRRAQPIVQLGGYDYAPGAWGIRDVPTPFAGPQFEAKLLQVSPPTRFAEAYGPALRAAPASRLTVYLHAAAQRLETTETGSGAVRAVAVKSASDRGFTLRARAFVAALGGIENARLLLLSGGERGGGPGNAYDLVGRFFMAHLEFDSGTIAVSDAARYANYDFCYDFNTATGGKRRIVSFVGPTQAAMRARRLPNIRIAWDHRFARTPESLDAAKRLLGRGGDMLTDVLAVLRDLDGLAGMAWRKAIHGQGLPVQALKLRCHAEQLPNLGSRVTLGPERDAFGARRVVIDWRPTAEDRRGIDALHRLLGAELGRTGFGRLHYALPAEETAWPTDLIGNQHHMGTTRMDADPRRGVVDADGRVHGTENLYVAGSSVFPTSGAANPTLTIVALALRLAAHLKERLG